MGTLAKLDRQVCQSWQLELALVLGSADHLWEGLLPGSEGVLLACGLTDDELEWLEQELADPAVKASKAAAPLLTNAGTVQ